MFFVFPLILVKILQWLLIALRTQAQLLTVSASTQQSPYLPVGPRLLHLPPPARLNCLKMLSPLFWASAQVVTSGTLANSDVTSHRKPSLSPLCPPIV